MPTLRGIDDRPLPLRAWLHERAGVFLRKLRIRADPELLPSPYIEQMLRARSAGRIVTTMRIDPDYDFQTYEERRALYTDFLTGFLVPETTIWSGDDLLIEVNSFGCRGPELEPGLPVIAFIGDSTTLGVMGTAGGVHGESWTEHVSLPGYETLNAGVEGLEMGAARRRYELLRSQIPLACAVFYTGWHNLIYNVDKPEYWIYNLHKPEYWEECLQSYLSNDHPTVLCTLPTSLVPEMRERGIDALLNESPDASITDDFFDFWRGIDPDQWLIEVLDALEAFNAHVADFCARTSTPLIDLHALMRPRSYEEAPADFFDVCHLRPRAYPKVADHIAAELRKLLPESPAPVADWRAPVARPTSGPAEDLRKNIYPVW